MSAESAPTPNEHIIPQGLLENSIKITNEPPTGMLANLHAALYNFDQVRKLKRPGLTGKSRSSHKTVGPSSTHASCAEDEVKSRCLCVCVLIS